MIFLYVFVLGIVAGLRSMLPFAAVAWASRLGVLRLDGTGLDLLAHPWSAWILTLVALAELAIDKHPATPSRTRPEAFAVRIVSGAVAGVALFRGSSEPGSWLAAALAGAVGAVLGTLGGRAIRGKLATSFQNDWPAALLEDAVAIATVIVLVATLP